jgi:hypothetical protein
MRMPYTRYAYHSKHEVFAEQYGTTVHPFQPRTTLGAIIHARSDSERGASPARLCAQLRLDFSSSCYARSRLCRRRICTSFWYVRKSYVLEPRDNVKLQHHIRRSGAPERTQYM